ncbi:hypothetical protein KVR01_012717 [Diaporthe batatas]|uniref:uncharacterized protein n=1 Tax=Diaporthe batatas TaxID=748121 RepID=UPI001D04223D|nr:uncharacterized protein KVR01_012717 [Diaporthe batatas]KAG8157333.1 hypothetical protein KVR01_012717 [Diaporthe batatas]
MAGAPSSPPASPRSPTSLASRGFGVVLVACVLAYFSSLSMFSYLCQWSFGPAYSLPLCKIPVPFITAMCPSVQEATFVCEPGAYRTQIVSLDPLLVYIHSFLRPAEIESLLDTAEPLFNPSTVTKNGRRVGSDERTSSTAGLPLGDPAVQCVLSRASRFMGELMREGVDEMGPPQLVRYTAGQKFNIHHDWYDTPQWAYDGSNRKFNRVASFFAILQDNCTDGETYFPQVGPPADMDGAAGDGSRPPHGPRRWDRDDPIWREHESGGLAFRPIRGNALFWVNLHADGRGHEKTVHAGLPVGDGVKTAMNIWPRQFYAVE